MPETLFHNDFSAGWCPSDDQFTGRQNCLLQMDNMELDRNGALTLANGLTTVWSAFPADCHTMFSRFIGATRYDYAALKDGSVWRNGASLVTGGDNLNAAFGTAFNYVLICSGTKRIKDAGGTQQNLGVNPPTVAPTMTQNLLNAPWAIVGNLQVSTVVVHGSASVISGNYLQCTTDSTGLFAIQSYPGSSSDCTLLSGPGGSGFSTDDDYIPINGYIANPFGVSLEFDVLLRPGDSAGDLVSDMYTYVVPDLSSQAEFDSVTGAFTVRIPRIAFSKLGSGAFDWSTVYGFRITVKLPAAATVTFNVWGPYQGQSNFVIIGGTSAQFGTYQYAQMNVNNTGSYLAKSILGPISKPITVDGLNTSITFQNPTSIDSQVNEVWLFRRGGNLGLWYRIAVVKSPFTNPTYDGVGDQQALDINIKVDLNLVSISSTTISDKIYDIVGPIQGRWYYFTNNFMYPSDLLDPDLVNASLAVRISGSNSELFMWARAVSASVVIVGTSIDCYLLTGTFATFPDGTVDIYFQPLGVKFPPVSYDAVAYGGAVYYYAADGWRTVLPTSFGTTYSNQNNQLLTAPNTDRLYRNEVVYGYNPAPQTQVPGFTRTPLTIGRNKLWCYIPGTGRWEIFDLLRSYWRPLSYQAGEVTACFATQDNQVLAFYSNSSGPTRTIEQIATPGIKYINTTGNHQTFSILFPFKDNGKPRQRKDTYTFKAVVYAIGGSIQLSIADERGDVINTTHTLSDNTDMELFVDLSQDLGPILPKTYQVRMFGTAADITIHNWSIDYDPRPIPQTFMRLPALNYGTTARKRIYTVPFQIDTLNNNVLVTPIVDGVNGASMTVTSSMKKSFDYLFPVGQFGALGDAVVGRDYEWMIQGQGGTEFEWWGFSEPRNMEVFPDPQSCYILPKSNFGTGSKKRFRTWPFVIDTRGNNVTFQALVDNQDGGTTIFNTNGERATVFHYFTTDVFGIDYGGIFTDPAGLMEIWNAPGIGGAGNSGLLPDSVENLPIYHEFDQVGPIEIFRFGKIVRMALRCYPNGTTIPFKVYLGDVMCYSGNFTVVAGVEDEYVVDLPKGVSGRILRVELGPCGFTFARYFMKFQVAMSASQQDTELRWLTVPGISSQMAGGI
jgi:hypothetical protein